jgi:tetratricopeptide (TPR) repeat protein
MSTITSFSVGATAPRVMRVFGVVIGICFAIIAACGDPQPPNAATTVSSESPQRAPEAVSLLGRPHYSEPPAADVAKLESQLAEARAAQAASPNDPERIVWVGRRLGYLWRMTEAIETFSRGIERHHDYAPFYRHRGHRYISVRQFDKAAADLEIASRLIVEKIDVVEQDGKPNDRNIPLTTLGFNVWYHLGVARYLQGDFDAAQTAFTETLRYTRELDDNVVAVVDWLYMSLRRLKRDEEAARLLEVITPDMDIIENHAYHRRTLMYKGILTPEELLETPGADGVADATIAYGVGNWYLCEGRVGRAMEVFQKIVAGRDWPAFGHIAAEADLARMRASSRRP